MNKDILISSIDNEVNTLLEYLNKRNTYLDIVKNNIEGIDSLLSFGYFQDKDINLILILLLDLKEYDKFKKCIYLLHKDIDYDYKILLDYFAITNIPNIEYWKCIDYVLTKVYPEIRYKRYKPLRLSIYKDNNSVFNKYINYICNSKIKDSNDTKNIFTDICEYSKLIKSENCQAVKILQSLLRII